MEAYELAGRLLLKEGEPCWNLDGHLYLDNDGVPHYHGWVVIGETEPGERRIADFVYADGGWKELESHII